MEGENLWQAVLAQIQLNISEANFATWFKSTKVLTKKNDQVIISAPNSFAKEWLENKYKKTILRIIHELDVEIKKIDFVVGKTVPEIKKPIFFAPETEQLELTSFSRNHETGLNSRYTFENFIVGSFNELAHAAGSAITENPGLIYNPLFVYGKVGLGKTHLLQASGNEIINRFPEKQIKYLPAERFISGLIAAIKAGTIEKFKKEHQEIDVLILDDVQFLTGKEKTQEEFFHLFNALYQKNKQIVLSSDRPPKAIPALAERLRSRFEGGMIADISYPELETRIAILKTKAQEKEISFSEDIYQFMATSIQTNIRELEGALSSLFLHQKMNNKKLSLDEVKYLLKKTSFSPLNKITPKKIIETVTEFYDIKEREIVSSSRKKEIVRARQIAMYILRNDLQSSYPFIARKFGGRDHTTAIYACEKINKELEKNENLEREISLIKMKLLNA